MTWLDSGGQRSKDKITAGPSGGKSPSSSYKFRWSSCLVKTARVDPILFGVYLVLESCPVMTIQQDSVLQWKTSLEKCSILVNSQVSALTENILKIKKIENLHSKFHLCFPAICGLCFNAWKHSIISIILIKTQYSFKYAKLLMLVFSSLRLIIGWLLVYIRLSHCIFSANNNNCRNSNF